MTMSLRQTLLDPPKVADTLLDDLNAVTLRYATALQESYDAYIRGTP